MFILSSRSVPARTTRRRVVRAGLFTEPVFENLAAPDGEQRPRLR